MDMSGQVKINAEVYVALPERSNDSTLSWVLNHISKDSKIIITHVYIDDLLFPMTESVCRRFPASESQREIALYKEKLYRKKEWKQAKKHLNNYLSRCSEAKFEVEKLMFPSDDLAHGLVDLITLHEVSNLVMGAAWYSKGVTEVKSKIAKFVIENAHPSCQIWFICEGNLAFTRHNVIGRNDYITGFFPPGCLIPPRYLHYSNAPRSIFPMSGESDNRSIKIVEYGSPAGSSIQPSRPQSDSNLIDLIDFSEGTSCTFSDVASFISTEISLHEACSKSQVSTGEQLNFLSNSNQKQMLQNACSVEINDQEMYEHQKIDMDLEEETKSALIKAEQEMVILHKEIEMVQSRYDLLQEENKKLLKERDNAVKQESLYKQEIKMVQSRLDLLHEENRKLHTEKDDAIKQDIFHEQEIEIVLRTLDLLQEEHKKLQKERDNAVQEVKELRGSASHVSYVAFSEFLLSELQQATENFSNTHKIGEGGFGCVYKGFLRNTMVAIKILDPQSLQGRPEFIQEVTILSTMRHPNLVTLIGTCTEKSALIYEYLPNGSLEDRLACQGGTPPLTWQIRTRIIGEICCALLFLHSNNPNPIVHGDLKPANILLDANLVSKISDFGISCPLIETNTGTLKYCTQNPRGTFDYMDPEFLRRGELTVKSDVYSFGIIILQLLTGKPPSIVVADVEDAVETDSLHFIIDKSAGEWPFVQAKKLAKLGLRCAQNRRRKRPDLESEWKLVESLTTAASLSLSPNFKSLLDDKGVPLYFMCPIFQEVMKEPHVAADGYTYEAAAIKGWLDSGHNTSPMTNLPFLHHDLTPNYALRSAIQEWLLRNP